MVDSFNKVAHTNPFPGLRSFELEDANLFFGRDNQIDELRQKLSLARFLAVIGASGSGKSSLVKAGLIPQLTADAAKLASKITWKVAFFTPEATPIRNFATALYRAFSENNRAFAASISPEKIEDLLLKNPEQIISWCEGSKLLIFIDQFEELFRYKQGQNSDDEVTHFIDLILNLSRTRGYPVYVVLTMRSDYLEKCTDYEGLTDAVNNGSYLLPKMNQAEIAQAISAPIALMGAHITPNLTARLLADIGSNADQLPILQHALMRTWDYWQFHRKQGQSIDEADYEAIGAMQKAVSIHAEEVFLDLPDDKSRAATEKLFKALIVLETGNAGVIQPLPISVISDISGVNSELLGNILDRFREPSVAFLTPSTATPADDEIIIDLAHERILILWERLHTWVKEETDSAKSYKQISNAAALYHQGKSGTWINPELQIGLLWLANNHPTQAWANRYDPFLERVVNFLTYSKEQFDFDQESKELRKQKELKRARAFAVFLGIGSLISLLFLLISAVLGTKAQQSEKQALEEKRNALSERKRAESQTREAITQKKIAEQQEIITGQQKQMTEEQRLVAVGALREADVKRKEAEIAKAKAEGATRYAENQRKIAQVATEDARRQARIADDQRSEAQKARTYAEVQRADAESQRGIAVARTAAIQSYQMADKGQDDLPALLAIQAYRLNQKNGGKSDDPDVFNALAKASKAQTVLRGHTDYVRTVAVVHGDGNMLASGSDDGTVKIWSFANPAQQPLVLNTPRKSADGIRSLIVEDGVKVVVGGSEKGVLYRWDTRSPTIEPVAQRAHNAPIRSLQTTADRQLVVSISGDGQIRTWKLGTNRLDSLQNIRSGFAIYSAQLSPDGKRVMCGTDNGQVVCFDVENLKKAPQIYRRQEFGNRVTALNFSPNGQDLVTGNSAGTLYAWKLHNYEPEPTGQLLSGRHTSSVSDIVFSPNGKFLASSSPDWSIHVWNYAAISTQQQPIILNDFGAWVMAVRFSNDSKQVIGCGADKTVRIRVIDTQNMYDELIRKLKRNLTPDEWNKYIGKDIPYEKTKAE